MSSRGLTGNASTFCRHSPAPQVRRGSDGWGSPAVAATAQSGTESSQPVARPVPALPGTGQMKGTRFRGQIRSKSPDTTRPILAAIHPEPPLRHTHRSVGAGRGLEAVCLDPPLATSCLIRPGRRWAARTASPIRAAVNSGLSFSGFGKCTPSEFLAESLA